MKASALKVKLIVLYPSEKENKAQSSFMIQLKKNLKILKAILWHLKFLVPWLLWISLLFWLSKEIMNQ